MMTVWQAPETNLFVVGAEGQPTHVCRLGLSGTQQYLVVLEIFDSPLARRNGGRKNGGRCASRAPTLFGLERPSSRKSLVCLRMSLSLLSRK